MNAPRFLFASMMSRLPHILLCACLCVFGLASGSGCDTAGPDDRPELVIQDLVVGTGAEAVLHATVTIHYLVLSTDEEIIQSSYERGEPAAFTLGDREVIQGLEEGILGTTSQNTGPMRVGGVRRMLVPPHLAYGREGAGCEQDASRPDGEETCKIPPNATVVYEVELLQVIAPDEE